jgi:hypothetical protein
MHQRSLSLCIQARWVSGSVKVTSPGHVFLLWKSSDALCAEVSDPWKYCEGNKDATEAEGGCGSTDDVSTAAAAGAALGGDLATTETGRQQQMLVLRRWVDLFPSMIFKCIIADRQLLAVSQKDTSTTYGHLAHRKEDYKVCCARAPDVAVPVTRGSESILRRGNGGGGGEYTERFDMSVVNVSAAASRLVRLHDFPVGNCRGGGVVVVVVNVAAGQSE